MTIPASQLSTWTNQGAVTTAKRTHESIRSALEAHTWPDGVSYEVYLQGSYKNDTNIYGDSDVDLVVQLNSTFQSDVSALSDDQKARQDQAYPKAFYLWTDFRADIIKALCDYYGSKAVTEGHKSIKLAGGSGRLNADVVPCVQYRKYEYFYNIELQKYVEGMAFYALPERRLVVNYPKLHYQNGCGKNGDTRTEGRYKPSVRMFKNARSYLVDHGLLEKEKAPSYFVECLLYNMPDGFYDTNLQTTFLNLVGWVCDLSKNNTHEQLMCQNGQVLLFGDSPEQWSFMNAVSLVLALYKLWENWN